MSCNSPRLDSPPPISHAIPLNNLVGLCQFALLWHVCFGIACDFVEPARTRAAAGSYAVQFPAEWHRAARGVVASAADRPGE